MPDGTASPSMKLPFVVCIPVFNDWSCVVKLMEGVDATGSQLSQPVQVLLVNDGSDEPPPSTLPGTYSAITRIEILHLRRNVGHQRAIALGLCYIHAHWPADFIVVMDADGEDSPADIPALVDRYRTMNSPKIVFAQRRKRTEGIVFRLGYLCYKSIHLLLTGRGISIGNFSVVPASLLPRVVGVSELWNHYAAGIVHARLPTTMVPLDRAQRLAGISKMNFVSLVAHGMSAISVYGDVVGVRLLCLTSLLTAMVLAGLLGVLGIRLFTNLAIPGWATNAFGLMAIILIALQIMSGIFVLFILNARNMAGFLPVRDWEHYVASRSTLFSR